MKIIKGQTYLTREKESVLITRVDRRCRYPVFGKFITRIYPNQGDWYIDGNYYKGGGTSNLDLISLAPTTWEDK